MYVGIYPCKVSVYKCVYTLFLITRCGIARPRMSGAQGATLAEEAAAALTVTATLTLTPLPALLPARHSFPPTRSGILCE